MSRYRLLLLVHDISIKLPCRTYARYTYYATTHTCKDTYVYLEYMWGHTSIESCVSLYADTPQPVAWYCCDSRNNANLSILPSLSLPHSLSLFSRSDFATNSNLPAPPHLLVSCSQMISSAFGSEFPPGRSHNPISILFSWDSEKGFTSRRKVWVFLYRSRIPAFFIFFLFWIISPLVIWSRLTFLILILD